MVALLPARNTVPAAATEPPVPAVYRCELAHHRHTEVRRSFRYRCSYWLVDVDALPRLPVLLRPLARFRAADHLGSPTSALAQNIRSYLAGYGLVAGRILLLTSPRTLGHTFNPLSLYYCFAPAEPGVAGSLNAVIAEVHNTYGGRHVYLLRPDESGRDRVDKRFYVSPFLPMGGRYLMRTPVPGVRLSVSIALQIGDRTPFVATLTGTGRPPTTSELVRNVATGRLAGWRTSALIRWQGLRLWLRGVPVQRRPGDAGGDETAR